MDLDAIEARANAATEGPWKHYPRPNSGPFAYQNEPFPIVYRDHPTAGVGLVILTADRGTEADVAFSAHARTDVPALVAWVRELEEENQKLRALVADLADDGTCWYDHHGYCQEHGWFATDPKCPHARARQITQEEA